MKYYPIAFLVLTKWIKLILYETYQVKPMAGVSTQATEEPTVVDHGGALRVLEDADQELLELRRRNSIVQHQAHDLANLLIGMIARLEVLKTLESRETRGLEIERIQRIVGMVVRIVGTIRTGREEIEKVPCDLVAVANDIAYALKNKSSHHIAIEVTPQEPIMAEVDPNEFWRLLHNLLKNAMDAIDQQIATGQRSNGSQIQVRINNAVENQVLIEVEDNGPGIPPYILKDLFKDGITTKDGPGHGFGLANVDDIVAVHGGTISVSSNPGKTVFSIFLPKGNVPVANNIPEMENDATLLKDKLVILVEDDGFVIEVTSEMLQQGLGATNIVVCPDFQSVVGKLSNLACDKPWLVILDGTFPGGKPEQVVALVKAINPDAKIVFHSGGTENKPDDVDLALYKPVELKQWRSAVRTVFTAKHQAKDALIQA